MQSLTLRNDLDINPRGDRPAVYHSRSIAFTFIFDSNFVIPSRSRRSRSRPVINNKRKGDWKQMATRGAEELVAGRCFGFGDWVSLVRGECCRGATLKNNCG